MTILAMRSCDLKDPRSADPFLYVLSGRYPEAAVRRMSLYQLEEFVTRLVHHTADVRARAKTPSKPRWWPNSVVFSQPMDLQLGRNKHRAALKRLVESCTEFCKRTKQQIINDENRETLTRSIGEKRINYAAFVRIPPIAYEPFIPLADILRTKREPPKVLDQEEFLWYFRLKAGRTKHCLAPMPKPKAVVGGGKLANNVNIPFSSDVGRIMAARENHRISEDHKLKRIERSEWYINKPIPNKTGGEIDYEVAYVKEAENSHQYKPPKRQCSQKRAPLRNAEFMLRRFCRPLTVRVARMRLDFGKNKKGRISPLIDQGKKWGAPRRDSDNSTKSLRSSPRLRNL